MRTDKLRSYLNYFLRVDCSSDLILKRLNDLELRGRTHKFNYLVGGTWKNFWVKSEFDPQLFFRDSSEYLDWDIFADCRIRYASVTGFYAVRCCNCGKENSVKDWKVEYTCGSCGFVNRFG